MTRRTAILGAAAATAGLASKRSRAAGTRQLTLAQHGRSNYSILLDSDCTEPMRHGALEIQDYLRRISGARLPVLPAETSQPRDPESVIHIRQPQAGDSEAPLGAEEYHLFTAGSRIHIVGNGVRGALYGCYGFLQDALGCRWFTKDVAKIPRHRTILLDPLDVRQAPALEYREPYYAESFDRDWAVRNRVNGNSQHLDASVGGRVRYGRFVHTFNQLVPPDKYFDKHPEYFSEINGKRMKGYFQLCLTNPDVLAISIARVKSWIKENPDATIFSVSQNDTYYNCQCPSCKAVEQEEGAPSGVLLRFVNAVADAIGKEYPHVL
ncbi:MAG TPA: DUF4838 domain-containing protein, partial [Chthonomonadales bacterium]|nr:DUF4838 domain-containing protein [Chthonomonadales bacterium]